MNRITNSRAYQKAQSLVSATIASPIKLLSLASSAQKKASKNTRSKVSGLLEPIRASYRLVRAYGSGQYRDISLESLGLIVAAMIYFVMPIDAMPDFILGLGLADDATLLAWTSAKVKEELDRFLQWEQLQNSPTEGNSSEE